MSRHIMDTAVSLALALAIASSALPSCRASAPAEHPTLRTLYGARPRTSLDTSKTALVFVDYQEEFFSGRLQVHEVQRALRHATELLAWARENGVLVVHVKNIVTRPGSPVFAEGSPTTAIVSALAPRDGEPIVVKHLAGGFSRTELDGLLRGRGIQTVVVAGIMTHLAVDTTVRDGAVLGYEMVVASDACTTRALPAADGDGVVEPEDVQRVALASLGDRFAEILPASRIIALPLTPRAR